MDLKIISKEEVLLKSLLEYFKNNNIISQFIPIIIGDSSISLRVIDWFITNYSYNNNIEYYLYRNNEKCLFNVYNNYKCQLKSYNKRFFDPFCRINKNNTFKKIIFKYDNDKYIQTTIAQINFFKWAINNDVILYINNNYQKIYNNMKLNKKKKNINKIENIINTKNTNRILNINNNLVNNEIY
tara:strand:- start:2700 stop:3251 length:552 start_codon:yes stop_codon:yes gene_type:complete